MQYKLANSNHLCYFKSGHRVRVVVNLRLTDMENDEICFFNKKISLKFNYSWMPNMKFMRFQNFDLRATLVLFDKEFFSRQTKREIVMTKQQIT